MLGVLSRLLRIGRVTRAMKKSSGFIAFGTANLYIIALATGRSGDAMLVRDLGGLALSSFGLVLLELGALAALRSWLISAFGFTWGI